MRRWMPGADHAGGVARRPGRARPPAWAVARPGPRAGRRRCRSASRRPRSGRWRARRSDVVRRAQVLDEPVAHRRRDRVARVGPVQGEPQHVVLDPGEELRRPRCRSLAHHQGIEGHRAAGPDDERVDVELGDPVGLVRAGEIHGEALHVHDDVDAARRRRPAWRPARPSSSAKPRSSRTIRAASSRANGGTRKLTSPSTSTNTPPSPHITTGPKRGSWATPTHHLDAAADLLAHQHAVDRLPPAGGPARRGARRSANVRAHLGRRSTRRRRRARGRSCG